MHVYKITDLTNGFIYVGQHIKENLEAYLQHNIRAAEGNRGNKKRLYRAIRAHGGQNFKIESLARLVDGLAVEEARELLDKLEIFFIRFLRSNDPDIGYNLTAGGGGQLGRRWKHTEEWKRQNSERTKGRKNTWAHKAAASNRGKKRTPEQRARVAASQRGVPKSPRSEEHRRRISENKKKWWAEHKDFKHSEESKEKTRQAMLGKKMPPRSEAWREQRKEISTILMQRVIRNPDGTIKGFNSEFDPAGRQPECGS